MVELQVVVAPLLFTADTTSFWSGPEFSQVTVSISVLHSRIVCTFSSLQGAEDKEVENDEDDEC